MRFITETRRSFFCWLLTCGPPLFCPYKLFSCKTCPGKTPHHTTTLVTPPHYTTLRRSTSHYLITSQHTTSRRAKSSRFLKSTTGLSAMFDACFGSEDRRWGYPIFGPAERIKNGNSAKKRRWFFEEGRIIRRREGSSENFSSFFVPRTRRSKNPSSSIFPDIPCMKRVYRDK